MSQYNKSNIVNKEQAINVLFATIDIKLQTHKENFPETYQQLIDEAKDYVLRNLT
jgi:hypothetical protein